MDGYIYANTATSSNVHFHEHDETLVMMWGTSISIIPGRGNFFLHALIILNNHLYKQGKWNVHIEVHNHVHEHQHIQTSRCHWANPFGCIQICQGKKMMNKQLHLWPMRRDGWINEPGRTWIYWMSKTTFLHTHHSLLAKLDRWGWLMRMRLAWKKIQKPLYILKRLYRNKIWSTGSAGKGLHSQLCNYWEMQTRKRARSSLPEGMNLGGD